MLRLTKKKLFFRQNMWLQNAYKIDRGRDNFESENKITRNSQKGHYFQPACINRVIQPTITNDTARSGTTNAADTNTLLDSEV